jgi:hypothetical protein
MAKGERLMNGFTGNRASGASERPGSDERVLTWGACRAMLPLVEHIAGEIAHHHECLGRLRPEQAQLDRQRQSLDWPGRARRYQLQEEITTVEGDLQRACTELDSLGLVLLHGPTGLVGFPTIVNDRRAFFSWRPGEEEGPGYWSFAGDDVRHPVPPSWTKPPVERPRRGKPRRSR